MPGRSALPTLVAAAVLLEVSTSRGITGSHHDVQDYCAVCTRPFTLRKCSPKLSLEERTRLRTVIANSRLDRLRRALHPRLVVLVGVTRAPDLAADLASRVQWRVHVGVAEASPDHLQDGR